MPRPKYPSDLGYRFLIRMPDGLKDRIARDARENMRSMNSEIIHRLLQVFGEEDKTATTGAATPAEASPEA